MPDTRITGTSNGRTHASLSATPAADINADRPLAVDRRPIRLTASGRAQRVAQQLGGNAGPDHVLEFGAHFTARWSSTLETLSDSTSSR